MGARYMTCAGPRAPLDPADRRPPMIAFARMLLICAALAAGAAAAVSYAPDSWFGGGVPMGPG